MCTLIHIHDDLLLLLQRDEMGGSAHPKRPGITEVLLNLPLKDADPPVRLLDVLKRPIYNRKN
jgi:hypothetical protein